MGTIPDTVAGDARAGGLLSDDTRGQTTPEVFLRAHLPRLVQFAYALSGNTADAEDLAGTAILAALPKWSTISGSPYAYVRQAVLNQHLSGIRAQTRHRRLQTPPQPDVSADGTGQVDERLAVGAALDLLADPQRTVLVLRYFEDLSVTEVARILNRPEGSIRRITHEGLTALRAQNIFRTTGLGSS